MKSKTIEDYMTLPYTIEVIRDNNEEDPGWVARVKELPGCITQGDTFEELGEMVEDALRSWIEIALEDGISIPEPRFDEEYSGKFVVRLPRSLHRELVETAEREGVSLNALVITALAKAVGSRIPETNQALAYSPTNVSVHAAAERKPGSMGKPKLG